MATSKIPKINRIQTINVSANESQLNGYSIIVKKIGDVVYVTGYINPKGSGSNLIQFDGFPKNTESYDVLAPCSSTNSSSGFCRIYPNTSQLLFSIPTATLNYAFCFSYIST